MLAIILNRNVVCILAHSVEATLENTLSVATQTLFFSIAHIHFCLLTCTSTCAHLLIAKCTHVSIHDEYAAVTLFTNSLCESTSCE